MKPIALPLLSFLLVMLLCVGPAVGKDRLALAEDDASMPAYSNGWKAESGGTGFRDWTLQTLKKIEGEQHAGFFVADQKRNADLEGAAIRERAFGMYANGAGFEVAAAFRPMKKPLAVGQTFSFLIEHGRIEKKFAKDDPGTGAIGLTLRSGSAAEAVGDYNQGARFEFGCYEGKANYQIYDGSAPDSGIPLTEQGLSVSLTLLTADTYDLEITNLGDRKTTLLKDRKLGGEAGAAIESFCIFNRDGEKSDAFFNGFQILGESE